MLNRGSVAAAAPSHTTAPRAGAPAIDVRAARAPIGARRRADSRSDVESEPAATSTASPASTSSTASTSASARLCRGRRNTGHGRRADNVSAQQDRCRQDARQDLASACALLCHHLASSIPPASPRPFGEMPADGGSASPLSRRARIVQLRQRNPKTLINREQGARFANAPSLHLHTSGFVKVVPRPWPGQTPSQPSDCPEIG
jgi:hypothetical protein